MKRSKKLLIIGGAVAAIAASGTAVATGAVGGGNDPGENASGPAIDKAKAAALAVTGGEVNQAERDTEKGATYEVEVTKPDGKTVDVRLDGNYKVVAIDGDQEDTNGK